MGLRPLQSLRASRTVHFTFTYTSTPPMGLRSVQSLRASTTVHFTFTYTSTSLWAYGLYRASVPVQRCTLPLPNLYSPYGPYCLYRASVPVQRCTLPLSIPQLPLWGYGLYRASVPVQRCTLPLPIPLLPLQTVRPVQNLSACTTVHFTFTYTSTPSIGRTVCTEPQCLSKGDLYLYILSLRFTLLHFTSLLDDLLCYVTSNHVYISGINIYIYISPFWIQNWETNVGEKPRYNAIKILRTKYRLISKQSCWKLCNTLFHAMYNIT